MEEKLERIVLELRKKYQEYEDISNRTNCIITNPVIYNEIYALEERLARTLTENLFVRVRVHDVYLGSVHNLYHSSSKDWNKEKTAFQGLFCIKPALEFLGIHDYDEDIKEIAEKLGGFDSDISCHNMRYRGSPRNFGRKGGFIPAFKEDFFSGYTKEQRIDIFRKQFPKVISFSIDLAQYCEGVRAIVEGKDRYICHKYNGIYQGRYSGMNPNSWERVPRIEIPPVLARELCSSLDYIGEKNRKLDYYDAPRLYHRSRSILDEVYQMTKITANYMIEQSQSKK